MATYVCYLFDEFTTTNSAGTGDINTTWDYVRNTSGNSYKAATTGATDYNAVGNYSDGLIIHSYQMHMAVNTSGVPAGVTTNVKFSTYPVDVQESGRTLRLLINNWTARDANQYLSVAQIATKPILADLPYVAFTGGRDTRNLTLQSTITRSSAFKLTLIDTVLLNSTPPPNGNYYYMFYSSLHNAGTTYDPFIQMDVDATPPVINTPATRSVNENQTLSISLTANESVTWSIVGGGDASHFQISGTTLRWMNNGTKNFEAPGDTNYDNAYIVIIRATDAAGNYTDKTITVFVNDVDENAPVITSGTAVYINENQQLSHNLTANESVTWAIVGGNDPTRFSLSGSNLRWASNGVQNYENPLDHNGDNIYNVMVRATDTAGNVAYQTINVHVQDVDEIPPTITSGSSVNVNEGTQLAHALTANEFVYWSINGGADPGQFEISGSNVLRWAGNGTRSYSSPADAGANNVYEVQIRATDLSGNNTYQMIYVTVLSTGGRMKVKVNGVEQDCPVFVKIGGNWIEKPAMVKVAGVWQLSGV